LHGQMPATRPKTKTPRTEGSKVATKRDRGATGIYLWPRIPRRTPGVLRLISRTTFALPTSGAPAPDVRNTTGRPGQGAGTGPLALTRRPRRGGAYSHTVLRGPPREAARGVETPAAAGHHSGEECAACSGELPPEAFREVFQSGGPIFLEHQWSPGK
jgi:hypothetical protein